MLLPNFTGPRTFPDKERTPAKMAVFSLYLNLPSARVGGGQRQEPLLCAFFCVAACVSSGRDLPEQFTQSEKEHLYWLRGIPYPAACKPASLTRDNKGNQALALRREKLCDCFTKNPNPTPRSCFFISLLPFSRHPHLPLHSPADGLLSSHTEGRACLFPFCSKGRFLLKALMKCGGCVLVERCLYSTERNACWQDVWEIPGVIDSWFFLPFWVTISHFRGFYGLNCVPFQKKKKKSYVEVLVPNVMVFGGRAFGRWLGLAKVMGGHDGMSDLITTDTGELFPLCYLLTLSPRRVFSLLWTSVSSSVKHKCIPLPSPRPPFPRLLPQRAESEIIETKLINIYHSAGHE